MKETQETFGHLKSHVSPSPCRAKCCYPDCCSKRNYYVQLGARRKATTCVKGCVVRSSNRHYRNRAFDRLCALPKVQLDASARVFYMQLPCQRNLQPCDYGVRVCKHGRRSSIGMRQRRRAVYLRARTIHRVSVTYKVANACVMRMCTTLKKCRDVLCDTKYEKFNLHVLIHTSVVHAPSHPLPV